MELSWRLAGQAQERGCALARAGTSLLLSHARCTRCQRPPRLPRLWPAGDAEAAPRDWGALLAGAGLQQRVTGKTVGGRYLGKEPEPAAQPSTSQAPAGAVL